MRGRTLDADELGDWVDYLVQNELLVEALRQVVAQSRPLDEDPGRYAYLAFFEAYFSNFIEGTEFEVDEAARIVFDEEIPANRPAHALAPRRRGRVHQGDALRT